ncbi:MAG: hypothetical protein ABIU87_01500 [Ornithinibacter sp.]
MRLDVPAMVLDLPLRLSEAVAVPVTVEDDDADSSIPAALRAWLVRLRLLEGVPFANLVADSELLPPESIRWFYLDRRWTDALVMGALSVGTVNSDDRTQLTAAYDAIRTELDQEERNARRHPGQPRFGGAVDAVSGFLLRSQAVSGWPGLHVRAMTLDPVEQADDRFVPEDDPHRMRLLRLERLAPAVLFCLFDGIPSVVHVEEPRQGVQFGFDPVAVEGSFSYIPRDVETFADLETGAGPVRLDVPFRATDGATGVIDIQQVQKDLVGLPATHVGGSLDAAEYALQLLRFPYRQVFGDPRGVSISTVFRASIGYAKQVNETFRLGGL